MDHFHNVRTDIEKRASTNTIGIGSFSKKDMVRFYPPPPGATAFVLGDSSGGAGWEVTKPDGSTEMYYVDLPPEIGEFEMGLPGWDMPAHELVEQYLAKVEEIVQEARQRFAPSR
jgi:hypothetical protein